jgi:hypothetical protein
MPTKQSPTFVQGHGELQCPVCKRRWYQQDEEAVMCCGAIPLIHDHVWFTLLSTRGETDDRTGTRGRDVRAGEADVPAE